MGESGYLARFRPSADDPHHCECGELSHIFGSKEGGAALEAFIAASQACVRPCRTDLPPEDHG